MTPPQNDAQTPMPSASPGSPLRARGKPSKVVATEEGVPGMPVRMPAIRPPDRPPTNTPSMVANPWIGVMPKVKGRVSTTAMVMVNPGIAPAINPAATPNTISAMVGSVNKASAAARMFSRIIGAPYQIRRISPSGRITRSPKVKIAHMAPIDSTATAPWMQSFPGLQPPRKLSSRKTKTMLPINIPA